MKVDGRRLFGSWPVQPRTRVTWIFLIDESRSAPVVKYPPSIWNARRAWTKYFVTGATGFIGGRVVRQLIEARHKVIAVVRNPSRAQDLRALGVDVRPGDVAVAESLWAPMTGVDGVFHIAGWYKIGTKDRQEGDASTSSARGTS